MEKKNVIVLSVWFYVQLGGASLTNKILDISTKKRKNSICSSSKLAACNVACIAGSFFGVLFYGL